MPQKKLSPAQEETWRALESLGRTKYHPLTDVITARAEVRGMSIEWFTRNHRLYRDSTQTKLKELKEMGLAEADGEGYRLKEKTHDNATKRKGGDRIQHSVD